MDLGVLAVIVLVILVSLYIYGTYTFGTLEKLGLKGPKPIPFLGNFVEMRGREVFYFFHEYTKKYGKVWACYNGRRPTIVVTDPDILKQVLVKEFNNFVNRDVIKGRDRKGVLVADEVDWRRIRTILTPTFSTLRMKQMLPLITHSTKQLVQICGEAADSKESTNVYKMYGRFTMEVILSAAFGVDAKTQTDPNDDYTALGAQAFKTDYILGLIGFCFPLLIRVYALLTPKNAFQGVSKVVKGIIQARRSKDIKRNDLLQLLLMSTGKEGEPRDPAKTLTDDEVVSQCVIFLLAGYETTSTALTFISYALALNPDVQDKLLAEIDQHFPGDQIPEYDQLHNIPYLDMVVNESLRLYPPAFRFDRVAKEECVINGLKIPKNVTVVAPAYSIHRDPEYWPEPEKFDPMRFAPEAKAKQHPYAFLPFGGGPRNCIGMRFALMEAKMALVMVLKKFKFERAPDTEDPLKLTGIITMRPVNGCYLYIRHREKNVVN